MTWLCLDAESGSFPITPLESVAPLFPAQVRTALCPPKAFRVSVAPRLLDSWAIFSPLKGLLFTTLLPILTPLTCPHRPLAVCGRAINLFSQLPLANNGQILHNSIPSLPFYTLFFQIPSPKGFVLHRPCQLCSTFMPRPARPFPPPPIVSPLLVESIPPLASMLRPVLHPCCASNHFNLAVVFCSCTPFSSAVTISTSRECVITILSLLFVHLETHTLQHARCARPPVGRHVKPFPDPLFFPRYPVTLRRKVYLLSATFCIPTIAMLALLSFILALFFFFAQIALS